MKAFHFVTFGCKVNQYETQALREAWLAAGAVETDEPALADVLCVNSCAVTSQAVADVRRAVRRLRREAPEAEIVVTGCAAAKILHNATADSPESAPLVDMPELSQNTRLIEPAHKADLLTLFATSPRHDGQETSQKSFPPFQISGFRRTRPVVKVQDGCTQGCAYCIVPLTRGPSRSRDPQETLAELRRLLTAGFREIMLSGINLRQYSVKAYGCADFWDLLTVVHRELAPEWAGRARLRLSSVDPAQLDAKGLETLAACSQSGNSLLCPHVHLSLQSGSAAVLRRMGRPHYSPEAVLDAADELTRIWPVFALGADILCGFPGETSAEADENLAVTKALPLTYAHVFPYSERPGTRAATLPHAVAPEERRLRASRVRGVVAAKRRAFLEARVGNLCRVALEPEGHGVNEWYVPCRPHTLPDTLSAELQRARVIAVEKGGLVVELESFALERR